MKVLFDTNIILDVLSLSIESEFTDFEGDSSVQVARIGIIAIKVMSAKQAKT